MDKESIHLLLKKCGNKISFIKIGMELFYRYGHEYVQQLYKEFKVQIFLDLKIHDIPNTAFGAIKSLNGLPIKFLTLHLAGGEKMLTEAIKARNAYLKDCQLLGVGILTSLDQKDFTQIWGAQNNNYLEEQFSRYVQLAKSANLDGLISSPVDLPIIKNLDHDKCLLNICPGVRFEEEIINSSTQDQKRVLTPKQAFDNGADYLVIGRSLTATTDDLLQFRLELLAKL